MHRFVPSLSVSRGMFVQGVLFGARGLDLRYHTVADIAVEGKNELCAHVVVLNSYPWLLLMDDDVDLGEA